MRETVILNTRQDEAVARTQAIASRSPNHISQVREIPLVEVDVLGDPHRHWIRELRDRWGIYVHFEVCRPMGRGFSRLLQVVELVGDPGNLGAAERYLRHRTDIEALSVLVLSPSRRFVRAVGPIPKSCRAIMEGGAICTTCQFCLGKEAPGRDRWRLVVPRSAQAIRTIARFQSARADGRSSILRVRRFQPPRTLTPRQATALETAFRLGFYAFPRRTNLTEIARILAVSRSTTAELLRRAEGKMLSPQLSGR